ncbi:MAG: DUF308 domain-containing protein [Lachnospiraceae bacterium]|nr:DUF308 domain-containing protein [Lachnospiraceae bacterium]
MDSLKTLKFARNGYIVIALVICAVGICLLINPECPLNILCTMLGIIFIADGIIKMIGYFPKIFIAWRFSMISRLGYCWMHWA